VSDGGTRRGGAREADLAALGGSRLFARLPTATLARVAADLRRRRVPRGAFVFLEGEPAEALHVLVAGRVKVVRETEDGREVILRLIGPGEIFGGAGGWGEPRYPASARAQEESVVLRLPADRFARLLETEPSFATAVVAELGARLREAEARIRELQTERVERRLARVLLRLADKTGRRTGEGVEIGVALTRQDLAELSGTTLSTASRTLSRWDEQGIVAAGREHVTILRPHQLVSIAEELADAASAPSI
jgi:CRP-like cAMP-binding protein